MTPDAVHVYPVDRSHRSTHRTDRTLYCWCRPERMTPCPECLEDVPVHCWRCQGRELVPQTHEEQPLILVHRAGQFFDAP